MIIDKSLKEFSKLIASTNSPVPAGGSTIAVTANLGIQLLKLCYDVSNVKKYPDKREQLNRLADELLTAANDDAIAFSKNKKNNFSDQNKLKDIINIPLAIAYNSYQALKIANIIQKDIKVNVYADYKIAFLNLTASLKGAIAIIEANYNFFNNKNEFLEDVKKNIKHLKNEVSKYERKM